MRTMVRQLLTGVDNKTHDVARWLAVVSVLTFLSLTVYDIVVLHREWKMQDFGIGLGAVLGAVGVLIKLKEAAEPPAQEEVK
jgi:uncharacterized membrane protein (DUF2068 family)